MLVYDSNTQIDLTDYGILIPVAPDRSERVLAELRKTELLHDRPTGAWLLETAEHALDRHDLERAHSPEYVHRMFSGGIEKVILDAFELIDENGEPHRYDPDSATRPMSELRDSFLTWGGRSHFTGELALDRGFAYHLGGGAHHGHYNFGHGFCILNDIVIAIRKLQSQGAIRTAWVIDTDAHKGDGTAALTAHDSSIATLSIHMAHSWPLDLPETGPDGRPHPSYTPSDIDVGMSAGEEAQYLSRLEEALAQLATRPYPDIAYVVGGVDPYEHDKLPSAEELKLTIDELAARDRTVFDFLAERKIPQAWLMAGGYGDRAWEPYVPFLAYALSRTL